VRNDSGTQKQEQSKTQTMLVIAKYATQWKWKNFNYFFATTAKGQHAQQGDIRNLQDQ
jgi:hypothetical protein